MELKQHPLSAAFPAMSAEDFQALKDDIEVNGQREPVMLFEGMVLDGWHRYQACTQLGLPVEKFNFAADGDAVAFVLSHNLHRRHLTPSQRAAAVVACAEWQPPNVKRGRVEPGSTHVKTNAEMAKAAQVTERTITDAKAAHKAGLGEPIKSGAMTVKEAARVARGTIASPAKKTAQKKAPPLAVGDSEDAFAEAQHTIQDLAAENEKLLDRLAVEVMDASEEEKTQAAETICELRGRVRALEAELAAVKSSRDGYMRNEAELKKQIAYWRKKAEKMEKVAA